MRGRPTSFCSTSSPALVEPVTAIPFFSASTSAAFFLSASCFSLRSFNMMTTSPNSL